MIPVTKPFLPPLEEYHEYLSGIWKRNWLTNMGPLANDLEFKLKDYLTVENLLFVSNGTTALQIAIKALGLTGEIITTPFSFVATTSSIVWENCTPVFADIDPESLNLDASQIEALITEKTTAILATHVYGNPCDVEAIDALAKRHNLKVIYDGAHAFGVKVNGRSVFEYGDISICSLHATKLYHSIEGGLLITRSAELSKKMAYMRNFGFDGPERFAELGINGKNSEFHAAMGLLNLKYLSEIHERRKLLHERYMENLAKADVRIPLWHAGSDQNYAYFPVLFSSEEVAMTLFKKLALKEIFARRYFYPSLSSSLPYVDKKTLPVTDEIAKRILCLPLYVDLSIEEVDLICSILISVQKNP